MEVLKIAKIELYKITHRKSSVMLLIPAVLSGIITICAAKGVLTLNMAGNSAGFSCMDFIFMVWTMLYGLGIGTLIWILFAAMQFSGELERGQIKHMLLRTKSRGAVLAGKWLAVSVSCILSASGVILAAFAGYYLLIAKTELGTGTFLSTLSGISTDALIGSILLQAEACVFWITLTFLLGIHTGSSATFVMVMVLMYEGNSLVSMGNKAVRWFSGYQGAQLISGGTVLKADLVLSVLCTFGIGCVIILLAGFGFQRRDIK